MSEGGQKVARKVLGRCPKDSRKMSEGASSFLFIYGQILEQLEAMATVKPHKIYKKIIKKRVLSRHFVSVSVTNL
jgi:hypothetical protein